MENDANAESKGLKHVEILGAISRLDTSISNLEYLRNTILGTPTPEDEKSTQIDMSLSEFLKAAPDIVGSLMDRVAKCTSDLKENIL